MKNVTTIELGEEKTFSHVVANLTRSVASEVFASKTPLAIGASVALTSQGPFRKLADMAVEKYKWAGSGASIRIASAAGMCFAEIEKSRILQLAAAEGRKTDDPNFIEDHMPLDASFGMIAATMGFPLCCPCSCCVAFRAANLFMAAMQIVTSENQDDLIHGIRRRMLDESERIAKDPSQRANPHTTPLCVVNLIVRCHKNGWDILWA